MKNVGDIISNVSDAQYREGLPWVRWRIILSNAKDILST